MFKGHDLSIVQSQVNSWLDSQNSNIERLVILDTNQSTTYAEYGKQTMIVISIFYERIKK